MTSTVKNVMEVKENLCFLLTRLFWLVARLDFHFCAKRATASIKATVGFIPLFNLLNGFTSMSEGEIKKF